MGRKEMRCDVKSRDMKSLADYQEALMIKPRLRYIFFELTEQCNLHCQHCGSNCDFSRAQFLPTSMIKKTLESISAKNDPRNIMVCLTGGEPFLHPELEQIVQLAHKMRFPVGITSNGTLIDDERAERLYDCGLDTIAISLDGTRETHDRFRGVPGSFDKALSGARLLKKHGIDPQAITVANKSNLCEMKALKELLVKEEFYSWRITNMDPIGRAKLNSHLLLSRSELFQLLTFIRKMRFDPQLEMEVTYGCSHFVTLDYEREVRGFYFQCGAGLLIGSVMADGSIGGCLNIERRLELIQGNIKRDDFMAVWENKFERFRVNRADLSEKCRECEHKLYCRGDSAHTWDYDRNEPLYCIGEGVIKAC